MPEEDLKSLGGVTCKLVCGADVLETFNTEGLWSPEDVSKCTLQNSFPNRL